ncbi:alpha/beta fold hydrolase [Microbacterium sp. M1A1_1b]
MIRAVAGAVEGFARRVIARGTDRDAVVTATERASALVVLMGSLEHLANAENRRTGGLNDWAVFRDSALIRRERVRRALDVAYRPAIVTTMHALRVAAALVHLSPVRDPRARALASGVTVATGYVLGPLHHNGGDGSDQAAFFTQALSGVARVSRRTATVDTALWAIAAQATLSYVVSGWVKLLGEPWRNGSALLGVMRTRVYGSERVWQLLRRRPGLARVGEVATLVLECGFPLVFVLGPRARLALLGAVGGMHLTIAATMGLGRFLPAFLSLQPAVLFVTTDRRAARPARDDTLPVVLGALAAVIGTVAATRQVLDAVKSTRPRDGQQLLRTSSGSVLAVRHRPSTRPDAPLVVFENSLVAVQEYWDPIIDGLGAEVSTLTYDRPGTGASAVPQQTLATYGDDLVELVDRHAGGRPVWFVAHSFGGHLLRTEAHRLGDRVAGVVLLDPTTGLAGRPDGEVLTALRSLTAGFPLMEWSLRTGWGWLLDATTWSIPARPASSLGLASVYRNARLWRTGRSEWEAAEPALVDDRPGRRFPEGATVVVVTASSSDELQPAVSEAHARVAAEHGGHRVVVRATHDGLLVHPGPVRRVVEVIRETIGSGEDLRTPALGGSTSGEER